MSFLEFPIRRYQFTLVAFAMLVALGVHLVHQHSAPGRSRTSRSRSSRSSSRIPGAEPQDVERLVVKPIEDRLSELDDVKKIESAQQRRRRRRSSPEFYGYVDTEKKYDEVVREINALRPTLPPEMTRLEIKKINPGLVNIVQFALVSPKTRPIASSKTTRAI